MTVQRILNEKGRDIVAAEPRASLKEVADLLSEKRIGAVVVLDAGRLAGILSERDIVRAVARDGEAALKRSVEDVMTRRVVTCAPSDTVMDVMVRMTAGRFRHLPVLDDGKLVGVVSIGDIVKRRIEDAEREAQDLKEYIATA